MFFKMVEKAPKRRLSVNAEELILEGAANELYMHIQFDRK
jgi:hypothetical protein